MITVISGTNRPDSKTEFIADVYNSVLTNKQVDCKFLKLTNIPISFLHDRMYAERLASFKAIQETYLKSADKVIIVSPEYNGSIPGYLKLFIDATEIKECWPNKKACLVGVSSGRAGNLRGMDHLTNILAHIGVQVYPNKLPISSVNNLIDENGKLNQESLGIINNHIDGFLQF